METRYIAILLFASLFVSAVSAAEPAAPPTNPNAKAMLAAGITDMQCRVAYDTGIMGAIMSSFPSLSSKLSFRIPILQADVQLMSQYANDGDGRSFHTYLQQNLSQHFKQDDTSIQQALESLRDDASLDRNTTKTKMRALKTENDALMITLEKCSNVNGHVSLVIRYYTDSLSNYEKRANDLASKGVDASDLLALVANGRSQILVPLQAATTGVNDSKALRIALGTYCLYDGCANGTNFHMAAKFEAMRMQHLISVISQANMSANMRTLLNGAQTLLNTVNSRIASWGTKDVQPADIQSVWGQITSVAKDLHEVFVTVKGEENTPQNG